MINGGSSKLNISPAKKILFIAFCIGLASITLMGIVPLIDVSTSKAFGIGVVEDVYRATVFYDIKYSYSFLGKEYSRRVTVFFPSDLAKGSPLAVACSEKTGASYPQKLLLVNGVIWLGLNAFTLWFLGWVVYRMFLYQRATRRGTITD